MSCDYHVIQYNTLQISLVKDGVILVPVLDLAYQGVMYLMKGQDSGQMVFN